MRTVAGRFAATALANATATGRTERLVYTNSGLGRWAYLTVSPHARTLDTTYPTHDRIGEAEAVGEGQGEAEGLARLPLDDYGGVVERMLENDVGFRTRTRTRVTGKRATRASAMAVANASSRW